ncbi:hypothetical protein PMKS-001806 [Pichia membranifaciens]|uniref:Uncharacterized protein n=1 Tax=Pichia membranifaciens TaxID=4926 RepID=A0A1Q2YFT4_9ASCO|nr:hypothetical protein PMKS-001806 [Pichia membranifaciens]
MEAPKRATKFAANDSWGAFWKKTFGVDKLNQSLAILNGACAGATESFIVVPFELIKIRLQDKTKASVYNGPVDTHHLERGLLWCHLPDQGPPARGPGQQAEDVQRPRQWYAWRYRRYRHEHPLRRRQVPDPEHK